MPKESLEKQKVESIESKEKEELPPVLLLYRDNDAFREYIPEIKTSLEGFGRKVEAHSFPVKTTQKEIEKWWRQNKEELQGQEIITDWTCKRAGKDISEKLKAESELDGILGEATYRAVIGKTLFEFNDYEREAKKQTVEERLAKTGEMYKSLLGQVAEENIPKRIDISSRKLSEHVPFLRMDDKEAAIHLKKLLEDAGIPKVTIGEARSKEEQKKGEAWKIADRHDIMRRPYKSFTFRIPIITLFQDLKEEGFIQVDPEKFRSAIRETIKKRIEEKETEQE